MNIIFNKNGNGKLKLKKQYKLNMKESRLRSVVKGITWRIVGTIDTMIIAFIITGKFKMALSIGGIEVITKIFIYYLHERVWMKIKWGKQQM